MGREYKCKDLFNAYKSWVKWETDVEVDKIRRDVKRHTEWWWLCLYDENGEIGKQAEFDPANVKKEGKFKSFLKGIFFMNDGFTQEERIERKKRLDELRKKQHKNIDVANKEFLEDYQYEKKEGREAFKTYSV